MDTVAATLIFSCCLVIAGAQENGDLRLSSPSTQSGRVEIFLSSAWGTIDASSGDVRGAAQTVCRQLGYDNIGSNYGTVTDLNYPPAGDNMPMLLENVECDGYNQSPGEANQHILRCYYDNPFTSSGHQNDMAVECINDPSVVPYDTQVRLVQGGTGFASTGFVEIYLQGSWGPVCNLDDGDADTVCRQLGYTEADTHTSSSDYDGGRSEKLDDFNCIDWSYSCLRNCFNYPDSYDIIDCDSQYSIVTCKYDESDDSLYGGGNQSVCSLGSIVAVAVGVTIAVLVVFLMSILACVLVCCCCIPGCLIHSRRRTVVYQTI